MKPLPLHAAITLIIGCGQTVAPETPSPEISKPATSATEVKALPAADTTVGPFDTTAELCLAVGKAAGYEQADGGLDAFVCGPLSAPADANAPRLLTFNQSEYGYNLCALAVPTPAGWTAAIDEGFVCAENEHLEMDTTKVTSWPTRSGKPIITVETEFRSATKGYRSESDQRGLMVCRLGHDDELWCSRHFTIACDGGGEFCGSSVDETESWSIEWQLEGETIVFTSESEPPDQHESSELVGVWRL